MKVKSQASGAAVGGGSSKTKRHDPLHVQMAADTQILGAGSANRRKREKYEQRESRRENKTADRRQEEKMSRKIMEQARQQMEEEEGGDDQYEIDIEGQQDQDFDEEESVDQSLDGDFEELDQDLDFHLNSIDKEEEDIIAQFMPTSAPARRNLADMIMSKIAEGDNHEMNQDADGGSGEKYKQHQLNEKVVEVYQKVGTLLSRYRSGKLPKAFKIIPSLRRWQEVLMVTSPDQWTPHAMYQATRIFASNLKPKMAQKFYQNFLLESVRYDMVENKKMNYHLYAALKKATYKPSAWFKGILLPMCESGCTLKEAIIMGSVLSKASIPVLHSAAALMKLAEMDYTGANSIFIRILLDKKYALPYRVIDSLVFHFLRFRNDRRQLPVLWHQSLLVFCQRYKEDLSQEQKEALLELLKHQTHHQISPEVRRELMNSKCRGDSGMEGLSLMPQSSAEAIRRAQLHKMDI